MNIQKLYEKIIQNKELHNIPLIHILAVLDAVFEAIGDGDCFYEID